MDAALIAFAISALICGTIVFLRPLHQRYSIDAISDFPGKVHAAPTPRIGGLAIFGGAIARRVDPAPAGFRLSPIICKNLAFP